MLDVGSETIPAIADLDGDGDLDLLLANKLDPSDLQTSFVYRLENVGTREPPGVQDEGAARPGPSDSTPRRPSATSMATAGST